MGGGRRKEEIGAVEATERYERGRNKNTVRNDDLEDGRKKRRKFLIGDCGGLKRGIEEKKGRYSMADQADGQETFPALHPSEISAVQMFGWR